MSKEGILVMVRTDILPNIEVDWNTWYNTRHIPDRLKIPGFISARRFVAIEGTPKYLAVYDLKSLDVLASEAYLTLRDKEYSQPPDSFELMTGNLPNFYRGVYKQIYPEQVEYRVPNTEIILAIGYDVPPNREEEFNAWYDTDHMPALKRFSEVAIIRRFVAIEAQLPSRAGRINSSPKYVTLCDLESRDILYSEAFSRETNSPWSRWVRRWFNQAFRIVGRRIYPRPAKEIILS